MKIEIIPIGDVNIDILKAVVDELNREFKSKIYIGEKMDIPKNSLNTYRGQYDAEIILKEIEERKKSDEKAIGITSEDIYTSELNFVFGLAKKDVAVVSISRLNPEFYGEHRNFDILVRRTKKEIIHELGHLFELAHCDNPRCVMSFSNSVSDVDDKSEEFCERCTMKMSMEGIQI
ncbi:MAG: archaemetzincin family Zn-dependent metalloprotease [Candidatus Aenigmarchaeota archaeon]|nr:archaemetzincin family Zn-dependent metalloprotease [Candidatus Aenigmarchaeota archaeon]